MSKRILFYFPSNKRAVSIETPAILFKKAGHEVIFLAQDVKGPLHEKLEEYGIECLYYPIEKKDGVLFYLKHAWKLAQTVKKYKIDVVFSNTQVANFPAVLAQFLCKARIVIGRHHCLPTDTVNFHPNELRLDKLINMLGREFNAPSKKVIEKMVEEGVDAKKIRTIRYGYDWNEYDHPKPELVKEIRDKYQADFLLVKASRYVPGKRHLILFGVMKKLIDEGMDIKCLALSDGPDRPKLEAYIRENNLEKHIFLMGFQRNILSFLAAGDLVIELSNSEASNNIIKEAGLIRKPVAVCHDVGDFDEYLMDGKNGFMFSKDDPAPEVEQLLRRLYNDPSRNETLRISAEMLHQTIMDRFSIEHTIQDYYYYLS
jgi:L-malate glycosyltransferase